jgi:thiol-disulfide isomerase/thioredoxin
MILCFVYDEYDKADPFCYLSIKLKLPVKKLIFSIILIIQTFLGQSQIAPLEIGKPAPELEISDIIVPKGKKVSLSSLRGRVIVVEFWVTWSGPCLAAFPHINELQEHFRNKPVTFISISVDEGETAVQRMLSTLKNRPLKTWIVKDASGNPT